MTMSTFLHSAASHVPSWFVSYLDCIISCFPLATDPASFGVAYGLLRRMRYGSVPMKL